MVPKQSSRSVPTVANLEGAHSTMTYPTGYTTDSPVASTHMNTVAGASNLCVNHRRGLGCVGRRDLPPRVGEAPGTLFDHPQTQSLQCSVLSGRVVHPRGRLCGALCTEWSVSFELCTRGRVHNACGSVWAGVTVRTFCSITRYIASIRKIMYTGVARLSRAACRSVHVRPGIS